MAAAPARPTASRPAAPRPPNRSVRTTFGLLMVLFLLLGAGILAGRLHHQGAPAASATTGHGRLRIIGTITSRTSTPGCSSGPNEVHRGATVIALDPNGVVLATAPLGSGSATAAAGCAWHYSISVPLTAAYQLQVAGVPPVSVSREQLQRTHGSFTQDDPQPDAGAGILDPGL